MTIAVCPGSFDPITVGHLDVIRRAAAVADRVVVGVARNAAKTPMFDIAERVKLARAATAELPGVTVEEVPGLLVDFAHDIGASVVIKGLRGGADLDHETPMALMNRSLTGIETFFVLGDPAYAHIASSLIKDVARHGGDIAGMVPDVVFAAVQRALLRERADG